MSTPLRELLALFDIQVDDKALKGLDEKLESVVGKLEHVAGKIGEVFLGRELFEFVKGTIEADSHLQELAMRLDLGAQTIRDFGFLAKDAGVDLDTAANSLGLLQKNLGEAAAKGGEAGKRFAQLGIDIKEPDGSARDFNAVLEDVSDALAGLPDQNARAAAAMDLFGRAGRQLLPVLGQGSEAFKEAMKDAAALGNGLGDDFYAKVKDAADGFEHATHAVQSLKDRAIAAILPAVEKLGKLLETGAKWLLELDKNTHIIQSAFIALSVVVGVLLVDALASATAAAWALLAPLLVEFGPVLLLFGGLVWTLQDLFALMTGGKSVIGDMIQRLFGLQAVNRTVAQLRELWNAVKQAIYSAAFGVGFFVGVFEGLARDLKIGDDLTTIFLGIGKAILAVTRLLVGFVQAVFAIPTALKTGSFEPIGKAIDRAGDAVFGKDGIFGSAGIGQASSNVADYGLVTAHALSPTDIAAPAGGLRGLPDLSKLGGVKQDNTINVQVHTASDQPKAVGEATGAGVATANQKALDNAVNALRNR